MTKQEANQIMTEDELKLAVETARQVWKETIRKDIERYIDG